VQDRASDLKTFQKYTIVNLLCTLARRVRAFPALSCKKFQKSEYSSMLTISLEPGTSAAFWITLYFIEFCGGKANGTINALIQNEAKH
jgi:hypothetical protein